MTEKPAQVRFARRFVIRHPDRPDIHGIELPSKRILVDAPDLPLTAATSINHIRDLTDGATIHWATETDEEQP